MVLAQLENKVVFKRVFYELQKTGPVRKCEFMRMLGSNFRSYTSALTAIDRAGFLLCEDETGKISAFRDVSNEMP
jgi:hypothetical protein